jgi:non-heme chloroperoxidase
VTFVSVGEGVRLYVQDTSSGPPVVLVAGFGLSHQVWDRQVRILGERHRVICVDQRGHGLSDKPWDGYTIEQLAQDLLVVGEQLDLQGAVLVGWSLGGQVAFRAAISDAAARFSRLVLIGSNAVRASRSDRFPFGAPPEVVEPALIRAEYHDRLQARRETVLSGFHRDPAPAVLEWLVSLSMALPSWAAAPLYHSMLTTDLIGQMSAVRIPVLQVIGDSDPVHSARGARWLSTALRDATLVELPDCGHYPMFEAPDALDDALLTFIAHSGEPRLDQV